MSNADIKASSPSSTRRDGPELLAPAGGPEPFYAALAAGADAIYCGMGSFNARRKADNFTDGAFAEACRVAHIAGTRVYVTVNIVIKDSEMPEAIELVRRCSELGADAFIIQDWGLFFEIRRLLPHIETHISTQANIHDLRATQWCRDNGADRVTLSRELSVDEIATISTVDIDLEVFAHGAICFCYSGVCLLSSFTSKGRSANRGMCAQPCRLPYELIDETGRSYTGPGRERALCPRDTCTIDMIDRLLDAGAHALKLEGRMKAPDYVYSIVSAYRAQLDDVVAGRAVSVDDATVRYRQLKRCFNRDFTHAYQDGRSDNDMMSYERSNNRGQEVGHVLGSRPAGGNLKGLKPDDKRRRAAIATIHLTEPVGEGDLLELRHDDEFDRFLTATAPHDAPAGSTIECRVARAMPAGCRVRLIRSQAALDASSAALKRAVPRSRAVDVRVTARIGEPFTVTLACSDDPSISATVTGFTVERARTKAVTPQDLIEHVGRMGSSPFEAISFDIQLEEGCGMGFSAVHKVRAEACRKLEEVLLTPYAQQAQTAQELDGISAAAQVASRENHVPNHAPNGLQASIAALVIDRAGIDAARDAGADRIYMPVDALVALGLSPEQAHKEGLIPVLDEVCREADHARLDPWVLNGAPAAVGNISQLALGSQRGANIEVRSCIPVHNIACMRALGNRGARGIWLSPELTLDEIERIAPQAEGLDLGITVFGRPRVMTSEHCILQVTDACIHDCNRCRLRLRDFKLKNIDGRLLPVRTDIHGRSHLYDGVCLDTTPQIPQLLHAGVTRFMIDGTLLTVDEIARATTRTRRAIDASKNGRLPDRRLPGMSSGCLFQGVE